MASIKKTTDEENNNDVVEFDYSNPAEHFNFLRVPCKDKPCDGLSIEMQFLGDKLVYQASDSSYWFHCKNCKASMRSAWILL